MTPKKVEIEVEVVFAQADAQVLRAISLPSGARVVDAIERSGVLDGLSEHDRLALSFGIWSRVVSAEQELSDGDRVEIYRPLHIDPREARRELAQLGQTMSTARND